MLLGVWKAIPDAERFVDCKVCSIVHVTSGAGSWCDIVSNRRRPLRTYASSHGFLLTSPSWHMDGPCRGVRCLSQWMTRCAFLVTRANTMSCVWARTFSRIGRDRGCSHSNEPHTLMHLLSVPAIYLWGVATLAPHVVFICDELEHVNQGCM